MQRPRSETNPALLLDVITASKATFSARDIARAVHRYSTDKAAFDQHHCQGHGVAGLGHAPARCPRRRNWAARRARGLFLRRHGPAGSGHDRGRDETERDNASWSAAGRVARVSKTLAVSISDHAFRRTTPCGRARHRPRRDCRRCWHRGCWQIHNAQRRPAGLERLGQTRVRCSAWQEKPPKVCSGLGDSEPHHRGLGVRLEPRPRPSAIRRCARP